jgi:glutathione gamma-glutamylcysteinyltransferase
MACCRRMVLSSYHTVGDHIVRKLKNTFWRRSISELTKIRPENLKRTLRSEILGGGLRKIQRTLTTVTPPISYHRRPLPENLIALASPRGRVLFQEALLNGTMECYFPLSEQFITQSEPSYCSLSSLAMVLNALNHDPRKTWKGVWRWVSEESLFCDSKRVCAHSPEKIQSGGMNFEDFKSLQVCQPGVMIQSHRVQTERAEEEDSIDIFRSLVIKSCQATRHDSFLICNFSRAVLSQTGDGHFSPIGGYHGPSDSVLILDVARFKYPPYWVTIDLLWQAMRAVDAQSKLSRGYFLVSSQHSSSCEGRHEH